MNKRALRHTNIREKVRGFTLLELMVTVTILVILLAIGAPQLQAFLSKRAVSTQADIFASALRKARSEAIKRGQRVTICPSEAPEASPPSCAASSTDWSTGWLIFVDKGDTSKAYDAKDELLAVQQALPSTGGIQLDSSQVSVNFAANGLAVGDNATFKVRPVAHGSPAGDVNLRTLCVVLGVSGRVRVDPMTSAGACPAASS